MVKREYITEIKKDFQFLERDERVLAVLLFGSRVKGKHYPESDFDICIVAPGADPSELIREIWQKLDVFGKKYDLYSFQELSLYLKIKVMENHEIIFSRDVYALSEYFYFYRKLWDDQKHRNVITEEGILEML